MTRRIYSSFRTKLLKSSHRSPGGGAGASHWPSALYPKHTARPLSVSSAVWRLPAAAFTYRTPDGKAGTEHCSWSSSPKATASPSERRITVCCDIAPLEPIWLRGDRIDKYPKLARHQHSRHNAFFSCVAVQVEEIRRENCEKSADAYLKTSAPIRC